MDQGIIANLKSRYRSLMVERMTLAMEQNKDFSVNVLDALHMISSAWNAMPAKTIMNCFRHAGFKLDDHEEEEEDDEEDNIPLAEILRRAQNAGVEFDGTFEEYISVDNDVATIASLTEEDIIQSIQEKFGDDDQSDNEEDDREPDNAPNAAQAADACQLLRQFMQSQDIDREVFTQLSLAWKGLYNLFLGITTNKQISKIFSCPDSV